MRAKRRHPEQSEGPLKLGLTSLCEVQSNVVCEVPRWARDDGLLVIHTIHAPFPAIVMRTTHCAVLQLEIPFRALPLLFRPPIAG